MLFECHNHKFVPFNTIVKIDEINNGKGDQILNPFVILKNILRSRKLQTLLPNLNRSIQLIYSHQNIQQKKLSIFLRMVK